MKNNPQKILNSRNINFLFLVIENHFLLRKSKKNILENHLIKIVSKSVEFKIIDKIEKFNKLDLEQKKFYFNAVRTCLDMF